MSAKKFKDEEMETVKCCICKADWSRPAGFVGHNPAPIMMSNDDGTLNDCCDICNDSVVIPSRIALLRRLDEVSEGE